IGDLGDKKEFLPYIFALPVFLLVIVGSFFWGRVYIAEVYMQRALMASAKNDASTMYRMMAGAINTNPARDSYHSTYAQTNILLANNLSAKTDITEDEKTAVQNFISQAIRSTRAATEVLNPLNVNNWETRAFVYKALTGAAKDADQWTISAYSNAIQLDPTNARLRLELGYVYFGQKDYLNAANLFRQATGLKNDYANAHYNFGHALQELKSYNEAQREYETTQKLLPADSEDYKKVTEDLEAVKQLIAQTQPVSDQTMPSVADLEGSTPVPASDQTETAQPQEPLVEPK
ncbi:MAG: hypothetical protein ACD_22C00272G0002, partial [uncultured bacterium]